ncbi:MAG: adenosylcobinamide-GDP ribazoletransferase, partial [Clostridia bacterium]
MWKEFRIAVSFLTRLPLPYKGEWDEKSFSRSSVFFPLVGLIIGLIVSIFQTVTSIQE